MNKTQKPLVAITGASAGIGKALALLFAQQGYPLLLMARRVDLLEALPITEKVVAKVDVANREEFFTAVQKAEAIYGPVDLMVNNAGVMPLDKFLDQPWSEKELMIETNLKGVINGMDAVLPRMVKRQGGTIINVSSVAGRYSSFDHAVYNATKFGLTGLTEAARKENAASNVRILLLEPGIVKTDLLTHTKDPERVKYYKKNITNLNGGLNPEMVAKVVLFTYELPQEVAIKELMITHTKQVS